MLPDGSDAYLPHVIRGWYALAWFNWHLKGDDDARTRFAGNDPFGAHTHAHKGTALTHRGLSPYATSSCYRPR